MGFNALFALIKPDKITIIQLLLNAFLQDKKKRRALCCTPLLVGFGRFSTPAEADQSQPL